MWKCDTDPHQVKIEIQVNLDVLIIESFSLCAHLYLSVCFYFH